MTNYRQTDLFVHDLWLRLLLFQSENKSKLMLTVGAILSSYNKLWTWKSSVTSSSQNNKMTYPGSKVSAVADNLRWKVTIPNRKCSWWAGREIIPAAVKLKGHLQNTLSIYYSTIASKWPSHLQSTLCSTANTLNRTLMYETNKTALGFVCWTCAVQLRVV